MNLLFAGIGIGILLSFLYYLFLVKRLAREIRADQDREYEKYIEPKYTGRVK